MSIAQKINELRQTLPSQVKLVAVSKLKPNSDLFEAYQAGQRNFGENYVQELVKKAEELPADIQWHFIGHLQSNKVKYIAPFVHLIHSVDSAKLLKEINKQAANNNRTIDCLLQMHIAQEDSKEGLDKTELLELLNNQHLQEYKNVNIVGLMGMSTFTEDLEQVRKEFRDLKNTFIEAQKINPNLKEISMGMSGDYTIAIEEGSTIVRIGSTIFGARK